MISITTVWIGAVSWAILNILSFLVGWADLRDVISGNIQVLTFAGLLHIVSKSSTK